ncbi:MULTISPECIES: hypothetical protein [unclassified Saccharothrix]|uniref:hypothetical protein n=1 Tax=unclassified Saccharothrix TaxID=2593673 RepID=UPI00307D823B
MSDDHEIRLEAIEALLRATPDGAASSTEVQLDAEFDAVMARLDDVDPEQAAELDALAARARQGVALAAQRENSPAGRPTPSAFPPSFGRGTRRRGPRRPIPAQSRPRVGVRVLQRAETTASLVKLVGDVTYAVRWGLFLVGSVVAAVIIADTSLAYILLATLAALPGPTVALWAPRRHRDEEGASEQPVWRAGRRRRR